MIGGVVFREVITEGCEEECEKVRSHRMGLHAALDPFFCLILKHTTFLKALFIYLYYNVNIILFQFIRA